MGWTSSLSGAGNLRQGGADVIGWMGEWLLSVLGRMSICTVEWRWRYLLRGRALCPPKKRLQVRVRLLDRLGQYIF